MISGKIFSDRYFIQQFMDHMHSSLQQHFGLGIGFLAQTVPIHEPLPLSLSPDQILIKLAQLAQTLKRSTLLTLTPTALSSPDPVICQLLPAAPLVPQDILVAAMDLQHGRGPLLCFWCDDSGHRVHKCPHLKDVASKPHALHLIVPLLHAATSSEAPAHPGTPSWSRHNALVHQLSASMIAQVTAPGEDIVPDDEDEDALNDALTDELTALDALLSGEDF